MTDDFVTDTEKRAGFLELIQDFDDNERAVLLLTLQKTAATESKSWRTRHLKGFEDWIRRYRAGKARVA